MNATIKGKGNRAVLVVDGIKCGISIATGPWIPGVNPAMIKIRPRKVYSFPRSFWSLEVTNGSDMRTDYFERDCIILLPGHALYDQAAAAA